MNKAKKGLLTITLAATIGATSYFLPKERTAIFHAPSIQETSTQYSATSSLRANTEPSEKKSSLEDAMAGVPHYKVREQQILRNGPGRAQEEAAQEFSYNILRLAKFFIEEKCNPKEFATRVTLLKKSYEYLTKSEEEMLDEMLIFGDTFISQFPSSYRIGVQLSRCYKFSNPPRTGASSK